MAKPTTADAVLQLSISRAMLYKRIDQGKVSATPDGLIDQAERVRTASYVDTLKLYFTAFHGQCNGRASFLHKAD
jgi:hypothetical protein